MPISGAKVEHIFLDEEACCHARGWLSRPDLVPGGIQCKDRAVMRDEVNSSAVRDGSCANFTLGIGCCIAKRPVRLAGIHHHGNPFVVPCAKHDCTINLGKAGGGPAGAVLPTELSGLLLKGVNVPGVTSAISGNEKCSFVEQRIAMEAARATIYARIVRPDFLTGPLVQRIQLARARSNEKKIATDRGCGKNSTAGFKLPHHLPLHGIRLPSRKGGNCQ
jgi:hypothetical protein